MHFGVLTLECLMIWSLIHYFDSMEDENCTLNSVRKKFSPAACQEMRVPVLSLEMLPGLRVLVVKKTTQYYQYPTSKNGREAPSSESFKDFTRYRIRSYTLEMDCSLITCSHFYNYYTKKDGSK